MPERTDSGEPLPSTGDPDPGTGDPAGGAMTRLSKPMIATAATMGIVLAGLPLLLSRLADDPPRPPARARRVAAGYTQPDISGGFVPGTDPRTAGGAGPRLRPTTPDRTPSPQPTDGPGGGSPGPSTSPSARPSDTSNGGGQSPSGRNTGQGTGGSGVRPLARSAAHATYDAVSGPRCTGRGTGFHHYNWYGDGDVGWHDHTTGGWAGNGCQSVYQSVPMSGSSGKDNGNSVVWTFSTGPVSHGTCRVSAYIPRDTDVVAVGGDPTYYTVQNQFSRGKGTVGSFTITQVAHRGQWVSAGSYQVSGGRFAVMLHSRGKRTRPNAHHAAAPIRATCTES
ncbi:hypothetical protein [Actinoallomurus iriomotensis]|uniref:Adhesin n=1 Tax=Actinoallomurus iriomotensis TaxID=478107 RepID=A0A9W6RD31_9ACTN|nr:hypothetical protein [Actinoallomurus iriomotensis]GLY73786.1 hypothetical protein Airi01_020530 [Actinoallomurus iriomotensis]